MKVSIDTDKKINTFIPRLLKESNDLSNEIKTRIKANLILNEFEKKAQNEFNFYVNDSNKRYINAKFGHDIEHYIKDTEPIYKDKLNKIMNDKFYTELNLKPEKEKMKKKSTNKIHKNITELLLNIKSSIGGGKSKPIFNSYKNLKYSHNNQERMNKFKYNKNFTDNELLINKKTIDLDQKILLEKNNENEINNIFNIDHLKLSKSIDKYKLNLKKIKIPLLGEENPENKKLNIDLPLIKMLYYQKPKYIKNIKDDNIEKINLNKLLPFSKYGRYLQKQNSENKVINSQELPYFITETINTKKINYKNTNDIVINTAKNNMKLRNNYYLKRNRIKELLEVKMPNLNEYDTLLKNNLQKEREDRINKKREIYNKQRLNFLTNKDLINYKIDKSIELLKEKKENFCK